MSDTAIVILVLAGWILTLGFGWFAGWLLGYREGFADAANTTSEDGGSEQ